MQSKFSIPKTIFKSKGNFTLKLFMESINAQTKKKKKKMMGINTIQISYKPWKILRYSRSTEK